MIKCEGCGIPKPGGQLRSSHQAITAHPNRVSAPRVTGLKQYQIYGLISSEVISGSG